MKNQTKSNRQRQMFFVIAAVIFIFAASSQIFAQKFKPGDRVECDPSGINDWLKGTVVAYLERDNPVFQGEYYLTRVKIDSYTLYPDGVLCQTNRVRLLKEETKPNKENEQTKNQTEAKFKPGDRVECDKAGIDSWEKGTVMPFIKGDRTDVGTFRVRLDAHARNGMYLDGIHCMATRMRLLPGEKPYETEKTAVPVGKATVDKDNTLSADRPIMECPVEQTSVRNGASPNVELFKKIIRCRKGEKPASKGMDGAVTVEITAFQIGAARQWIYSRDIGGKPGTRIYPVKVTYTVKTFYRNKTEVSQNWIRILNFYVNEFGEWTIGSEEPIKIGETVNVPREQ